MQQVIINSFSLSITGLVINYTQDNVTTNLKFDAKATCNLFEGASMIEGFDLDKNGEPVIYYTETIYGRSATAFCMWFEFVKTYPLIQRHAEILVEYLIDTKATRKAIAKINYLLYPTRATA